VAQSPAPEPIQRLSTGSAPLDEILGGGIPARSVNVIAGLPGTGKTVLALQMLFHVARQGKRCLYFTTLSEPAIKLIHYLQGFPFFDQGLVDDRVFFADLGSSLRRGAEGAMAEVTARVERVEPDLVVIDSFKAIHDLLDASAADRVLVYDLAVHMASWGATTLLVGEYAEGEIATRAEFAIADGIIRLITESQGLSSVRMIEVLKMRGQGYATGQHFFEIARDGLRFYPRVRLPEISEGGRFLGDERVGTGIEGLDQALGGGIPRTSSTLVEGGTGTGKTLLGLRFLLDGARWGEPGILLSLEETPEQMRWAASHFGWDLAALEAQGLLAISYSSPVELSTDRFLNMAREQVRALGARRAVLDSLSSLSIGIPSERRYRELVYALSKHYSALGVTLLMTLEVPELLGSAQLTGHGVSSITDNAIGLRYVEIDEQLERAIYVLKVRGVKHDTGLHRLIIDSDGPRFGPPFKALRGVLSGIPIPAAGGVSPGDPSYGRTGVR
jgi:circadian clock protein KaiC